MKTGCPRRAKSGIWQCAPSGARPGPGLLGARLGSSRSLPEAVPRPRRTPVHQAGAAGRARRAQQREGGLQRLLPASSARSGPGRARRAGERAWPSAAATPGKAPGRRAAASAACCAGAARTWPRRGRRRRPRRRRAPRSRPRRPTPRRAPPGPVAGAAPQACAPPRRKPRLHHPTPTKARSQPPSCMRRMHRTTAHSGQAPEPCGPPCAPGQPRVCSKRHRLLRTPHCSPGRRSSGCLRRPPNSHSVGLFTRKGA